MARFDNRYAQVAASRAGAGVAIDEGLRAYMLRVYNYMAAGVALTGIISLLVFSLATTTDASLAAKSASGAAIAVAKGKFFLTPLGYAMWATPLKWVLMFAPLGFCFLIGFGASRFSPATTQMLFWAFAALVGISLSVIFMVYTQSSIARIFFISAAMFAALSLWGYTTKRDLSGWGQFLFMGMIGVFLAIIVNIWLQSPALMFAVSVIGVLVFAGFTAYDTQQIKDNYYEVQYDGAALQKSAVLGAFMLYTDFINIFQFMLSLFGDRE
jgi:FtsH-binding integral membrane protein